MDDTIAGPQMLDKNLGSRSIKIPGLKPKDVLSQAAAILKVPLEHYSWATIGKDSVWMRDHSGSASISSEIDASWTEPNLGLPTEWLNSTLASVSARASVRCSTCASGQWTPKERTYDQKLFKSIEFLNPMQQKLFLFDQTLCSTFFRISSRNWKTSD